MTLFTFSTAVTFRAYKKINSQSKLTQEQLTELQQATLFERKELQQWYKGSRFSNPLLVVE
jgi:hypothetical protein